MNALHIAALSLQNDLDRLRISAHNVANVATPAFKRRVAVQAPFTELMAAGAGVQTQIDARAGALRPTGQSLDLTLPESCFLLVEAEDGQPSLTRQGALSIDARGALRTVDGLQVLGLRGAITVRTDAPGTLEVDGQGRLLQQGQVVDTLRLVRLKPGHILQPTGDGRYAADPSQWQAEPPAFGVRSGHLEASNVSSSQEMLHVMASVRHAETMARVFQAADDMQATAIRRLGESN